MSIRDKWKLEVKEIFVTKNTILYKKNRRPPTTWNDKKSAILKDTIKNVSSSYYGARTLITFEFIFYFFYVKEFPIFKQVVDKKLRHRLLTFCLTIHMHCIFPKAERNKKQRRYSFTTMKHDLRGSWHDWRRCKTTHLWSYFLATSITME